MARKTTPTHVLLNQIELSSATSNVIFSNLPQGYGDLVVVAQRKLTSGVNSEKFYLNGDTTNANYTRIQMYGTGTTRASTSGANSSTVSLNTTISTITYNLMDYSATDKDSVFLYRDNNTTNLIVAGMHRWNNTAAVTSINLQAENNTYAIGSIFSLYGVYA